MNEFARSLFLGGIFTLHRHRAVCRKTLTALAAHGVYRVAEFDELDERLLLWAFGHDLPQTRLEPKQEIYWDVVKQCRSRPRSGERPQLAFGMLPGLDWQHSTILDAPNLAAIEALPSEPIAVLEESTVVLSAAAAGQDPELAYGQVVEQNLSGLLATYFDRPFAGKVDFLLQLHAQLRVREIDPKEADLEALREGEVPAWLGAGGVIADRRERRFLHALFDPALEIHGDARPRGLDHSERLALLLMFRGHLNADRISRLLYPHAAQWAASGERVAEHLHDCLVGVLRSPRMD